MGQDILLFGTAMAWRPGADVEPNIPAQVALPVVSMVIGMVVPVSISLVPLMLTATSIARCKFAA
jgi:hypothetical protein